MMIIKIKNSFLPLALFAILTLTNVTHASDENKIQVVTLGALNKISAKLTSIDIQIGEKMRFGTLEITALKCRKNPPEEKPETTAFLMISDYQNDGSLRPVFKGWMFASSPALSPLEHGVYDVWVTNCKMLELSKSSGIE